MEGSWQQIYSVIWPVLYQSKILGLLTFSFSKKGINSSKLNYLINLVILLIYIPLTIFVVKTRFESDLFFIYKTTDIIQMTVSLIYVTTAWISGMVHQKMHIQVLQNIINYDEKLHSLGYKVDYIKSQKIVLFNIFGRYLVAVISGVGQILTYSFPSSHFIVATYFVYYFPIIITPAVCIQLVSYVFIVRLRLTMLNDQLIKLTAKSPTKGENNMDSRKQLTILNNVCSLHHHITKIIKQINDTFGVTLLVTFGVSFVNIVVGLYYCSNSLRSSTIDWTVVINNSLLSLGFILETVVICSACENTIEEVKKTGILIHKIETDNEEIKDEIEMFSLQIANEEVEFNAAGFFPINFTLLFSIIGGVTTYIIILIQLSTKP